MRVLETSIETNLTRPTVGNRTPLSPVLDRGISSYAIVGILAKMVFSVTYAALHAQSPVGGPDLVAIQRGYCV